MITTVQVLDPRSGKLSEGTIVDTENVHGNELVKIRFSDGHTEWLDEYLVQYQEAA